MTRQARSASVAWAFLSMLIGRCGTLIRNNCVQLMSRKHILFDPTNPRSSAYNPLLEVRRGDAEVRDVQNVADILVDPEGALERRNHWEKTSHALSAQSCTCFIPK